MNELDKTEINEIELHSLVLKVFESELKFKDIEWKIVIKNNAKRGENFDVVLTSTPPNSSLAVSEFLERIFEIKGMYWLDVKDP